MNITRGRIKKAVKLVLYGPEGIGKSTLAAQCPGAVFIDTEDSTAHMDVARFDKPSSWEMLKQQAEWVKAHPQEVGTLVLDTADWAEQMEVDDLCRKKGWDGLEGAGYGKGYTYSAEEFGKLLNILQGCVNAGVNVVITAHAQLRKVELPEEMGAYDHWEMKTSKKVAPMIREWADSVFFLNYKTVIVNVDGKGQAKGKNKAQGGRRVMYTTHTPFWDGKNRFGLPDELPLDFSQIAHIFRQSDAQEAPQERAGSPVTASEPAVVHSPAPAPESRQKANTGASGEKTAAPAALEDTEPVAADEFVPPPLTEAERLVNISLGKSFGIELPSDQAPWIATEKQWIKYRKVVYEFLKGEKIPFDIAQNGKPATEAEYREFLAAKAREDIRTVKEDADGYREPDMRIPKKLRDLMIAARISEDEIRTLVGTKGYFPPDMAIADYPADFIDGWCVGYWEQVKAAVMEIRKKEEYEFR